MEIPKIICPVCGGEVRDDDCLDRSVDLYESFEFWTGTCIKCGEIVEYNRVYPHKSCEIEVMNHYKD